MTISTNTYTDQLMPYTVQNRYADLVEIIRHKKIISLCILFSVGLHIAFLIRVDGLENKNLMDMPVSHSVDITLTKYIPEDVPQIQQQTQPVKRKTIEKPKPVEPKIVAPTETQPVVKEQVVEEVIEEEPLEEPVEETIAQTQANNAPVDPALISSDKALYLESIAAHLDKHKFYPRSARRRHIEGDVKVSFDLLQDGNILNLKIMSGHSALQKATSESINSSLPMPPRPESLLTLNTMTIEYSMQFSLN